VKANQRLVMNFYTAKRLLTALGMTIQRHEGMFGAIELDVRRRAHVPQGTAGGERPGPKGVVD
jgi:acyl-coenzyme A thioesterase PaaI-like protein